jgi:hypothetical protein
MKLGFRERIWDTKDLRFEGDQKYKNSEDKTWSNFPSNCFFNWNVKLGFQEKIQKTKDLEL